jgi:hypothetical protein
MPAATVITVRMTIAASGAGITLVTFGKNTISASPSMISGRALGGGGPAGAKPLDLRRDIKVRWR